MPRRMAEMDGCKVGKFHGFAGLVAAILLIGAPEAARAQNAADCDVYARNYANNYSSGEVLGSAARGAVRGTLLGGIFGGHDGWGRGAAIGAGVGAIAGGVERNQDRRYLYDQAYRNCMAGNTP